MSSYTAARARALLEAHVGEPFHVTFQRPDGTRLHRMWAQCRPEAPDVPTEGDHQESDLLVVWSLDRGDWRMLPLGKIQTIRLADGRMWNFGWRGSPAANA